MKTYFYSALMISLFLLLSAESSGQGRKIDKTYQWKTQVHESVICKFSNYNCDLIIHTWDQSAIEYKMTVNATLRTEEGAATLDEYLDHLEFSPSEGSVRFDNRFWSSKKTVRGNATLTLKGGGKLRFTEFNMKGELWIPKSCLLDLVSKYSEISMDDIQGRLTLDLYNDKLYGAAVNGPLTLKAKYSTLEFSHMKDIEADLYNTSMETGDVGDLKVVSKYSDVRTGNTGKVDIDAYNDKYIFENTGDIRFTDKYSDLKAGIAGQLRLDCYNSTVDLDRAGDVELASKYGKYTIQEVRNLNISSAYNDNLKMQTLQAMDIRESKYGTYRVDFLDRSLILEDGYSDKFLIGETGDFKELKLDGKYIDLEMTLDRELSYRFEADVNYPSFNINEESMNVTSRIKEGSNLQMKAVRGRESDQMAAFFVHGYEIALTLSEKL